MPLDYVQTAFYDTAGPLYPGQLADAGTAVLNEEIRSYRSETLLVPGSFCVKGTANPQDAPIFTPHGVKAVLAGSVLADLVGIVVRTAFVNNDVNGNAVTNRATTMVPVAETGSKAIIGAQVPAGITIADGDPVYVSVSHASIPVGMASNAAATGLIGPVVGAKWYGAAAPGTVGRIEI